MLRAPGGHRTAKNFRGAPPRDPGPPRAERAPLPPPHKGQGPLTWRETRERDKNHSTRDSHVVPHHGTNRAVLRLTAQIGRDAVLSESYGRGYLPCRRGLKYPIPAPPILAKAGLSPVRACSANANQTNQLIILNPNTIHISETLEPRLGQKPRWSRPCPKSGARKGKKNEKERSPTFVKGRTDL